MPTNAKKLKTKKQNSRKIQRNSFLSRQSSSMNPDSIPYQLKDNFYNDIQSCKSNQIKDESQVKELLFGGGAGGLAYELGYAQALIDILGRDYLKQYKIGGVSCGSIVATLVHISLYQEELQIKDMYNKWVRVAFQKENKRFFGLFSTGKVVIRANAQNVMDFMEKHNIPQFKDNLHVTTSVITKTGLKQKVIDDIQTTKDFIEALESSCGIPFLIKFGVFMRFRGQMTLDGQITRCIPYKYENSQKIFLNVLPKYFCQFPFMWSYPKNCQIIHITEGKNKIFPRDYLLWNADWADQTFQEGYDAAFENQNEIKEIFQRSNNTESQQDIIGCQNANYYKTINEIFYEQMSSF